MDRIQILYIFFLLHISTIHAIFKCGCPAGPRGLKGEMGETGAQGQKGDTGSTGPQGPAGAPGIDGTPGAPGSQGMPGPAGTPGTNGAPGAVGAPGAPGATGPRGPRGFAGQNGIPGIPGAVGAPGAQGTIGPQGPRGPRGLQGIPGLKGEPGDCTCTPAATPATPAPPVPARRGEMAASISQMTRPYHYDPYYEFSAPHQFDPEAVSDIFNNPEAVEVDTEDFDYVEGSGNQFEEYDSIQHEAEYIENTAENEIEDNNQQNALEGKPNRKNNRVSTYDFRRRYHKLRAGVPILVPPAGVPSTSKRITSEAQFYAKGPSVKITTYKNLKKVLTGPLEAAIIEIRKDIYELQRLYRDLSGNRL